MRFHTLLFICLLCVPGVNRLLAQRPQGSSQSFTAVAAKGTDLLALSSEGQILLSTDGTALTVKSTASAEPMRFMDWR